MENAMKQVAINGFGRIGRNVLRALIETPREDFRIVAINDLAPAETAALLLELDRRMAGLPGRSTMATDISRSTASASTISPSPRTGILRLEQTWHRPCHGMHRDFTAAEDARREAGAGILVSAPSNGADATIVYGVNHDSLAPGMKIISNASCTTNCSPPWPAHFPPPAASIRAS